MNHRKTSFIEISRFLKPISFRQKMIFKIKKILGKLISRYYATDCDLAFEKFEAAIIEEVNKYIPLKRSTNSKQPNWMENIIKNLAAKNSGYTKIIYTKLVQQNQE